MNHLKSGCQHLLENTISWKKYCTGWQKWSAHKPALLEAGQVTGKNSDPKSMSPRAPWASGDPTHRIKGQKVSWGVEIGIKAHRDPSRFGEFHLGGTVRHPRGLKKYQGQHRAPELGTGQQPTFPGLRLLLQKSLPVLLVNPKLPAEDIGHFQELMLWTYFHIKCWCHIFFFLWGIMTLSTSSDKFQISPCLILQKE